MLASITNRINNLIKSMQYTIIPAINPDDSMAQEQAALLVGHLKVINEQWDKAFLFELGTLKGLISATEKILAKQTPATGETAKALTAVANTLQETKEASCRTAMQTSDFVHKLGLTIENLLDACEVDGSEAFRNELEEIVLDYTKNQSMRERIWNQFYNLDPDREKFPTIDEMLDLV
ncbi:MAG: hypothetical protein AB7U63_03825 [Porticoccaceae bacterium]|jgi:hypothetical protein